MSVERSGQITPDVAKWLLDNLFAEHGRTSCSDENISNGYVRGVGYARCNRCLLLEIVSGEVMPEMAEYDIHVIIVTN